MDNKKYEQLIDLIINEQEEKARELFHEIVVEKSREIYENIMDEEAMEEGSGMVGEVGDLIDEISTEEAGGMTEEDDLEVVDLDAEVDSDDMGDEEGHGDHEGHEGEDLEDRVVDLEDKLDELMAEFESLMGNDAGEEDMGGEEDMMEASEEDEEDVTEAKEEDEEAVEESEEKLEEAVNLKQVGGKTYNTFGKMGDNGANTKSPALHEPKVKAEGVKPVKFSGDNETVPTSPKAPSNAYAKGHKEVPEAGKFKNVPGQDNFKEKGESAPKPVTSQASGVNNKSPVAKG